VWNLLPKVRKLSSLYIVIQQIEIINKMQIFKPEIMCTSVFTILLLNTISFHCHYLPGIKWELTASRKIIPHLAVRQGNTVYANLYALHVLLIKICLQKNRCILSDLCHTDEAKITSPSAHAPPINEVSWCIILNKR
jgi:hypothetical protein